MFKNILVPLDGSIEAEQALPVAARIARRTGGSVILVHVIPPFSTYTWYGPEMAFALPDALEKERVQAGAYLQTVCNDEILHDLPTVISVVSGQVSEGILEAVTEHQASMMVMCSHGQIGLGRVLLGSVVRQVVRHAPVPVLVMRPVSSGEPIPFTSDVERVRVMVTLDGSELAEQSIAPAAELSQLLSTKPGAMVHLACVLPFDPQEQKVMITMAQRYLMGIEQKFLESEQSKNITLTSSISQHIDVAEALVELAEGRITVDGISACNLIAMATHGRSGVRRWMAGSVTERVLDLSKLPLLIVRAHQTIPQPVEEKIAHHEQKQKTPQIPVGVAIESLL